MAIHRWGEGVWARAIALAVAALFIIWGSASLYSFPAGFSSLAERQERITAAQWDALVAYAASGGPDSIIIDGLTAVPVSDELIGLISADNVGLPGRQPIVKSGEALTKEMVSALRNAEITAIPIKDQRRQKVEERIVDVCTLDEGVGSAQPIVVLRKGWVVTAENLQQTKDQLLLAVPPLGTREEGKGPKVHRKNDKGETQVFELRQVDDVQVGDEFVEDVTGQSADRIAEAGALIDQALYLKLKEQGILEVDVKDSARLPISAATKSKLTGWYVRAGESVERHTFWTTELFMIPLLDWVIDWGVVICGGIALVLLAWGWRYCNKPSVVDHLIETQAEMKKVSWPSSRELVGSSVVVIAFIVVIAVFLFGADVLFAALAKLIRIYPGESA